MSESADDYPCVFPPSHRLRKRRDFLRIGDRGARLYSHRFIFSFRPAATSRSRLGITVSKKVGNAVVRNRVKRWVREAWRQHPERLPKAIDVVITAKRGVSDFSYQAIDAELAAVLRRYFAAPPAADPRRRKRRTRRRRQDRPGSPGAGGPSRGRRRRDPDRIL